MSAPFAADLDPQTGAPRLRFNFSNGWTASLVLGERSANGCDAWCASLACWPTGQHGRGLTELGAIEATPDQAIDWLQDVSCRATRA